MAMSPAAPSIEWVFGCNTVLGGVAAGWRTATMNGSRVPYSPNQALDLGARWCSQPWLDRNVGRRGFLARTQSGTSRFAMHVAGQISSGIVVVVPDRQVEQAVALAARLVAVDLPTPPPLREWSMAVVREVGRSRIAVRLAVEADSAADVMAQFATRLDVEYLAEFGFGDTAFTELSVPDVCRVTAPDGSVLAELPGLVHLEGEPVPVRLIDIALRYGNGLRERAGTQPGILVPTSSHRPLEPDEWDVDRDRRQLGA